jgi:hypothetical protein
MRINATEFFQMLAYRQSINRAPLEDLELYDELGKRIDVPADELAELKLTGLGNCCLVQDILEGRLGEGGEG